MSMLKTNSEIANIQPAPDPAESGTAVVFRGDGEPDSPRRTLERLAEIDAGPGFESDSYSLGGSVAALERYFADALGKEAAIFMPTGTLANHLAVRALCGGKPRAIVPEQSHLYHDSGDCVQCLSSINLIPLAKGRPGFTLEELREAVSESVSGRVASPVGAMMIESPVRRQQGRTVPYQDMKAMTGYWPLPGHPHPSRRRSALHDVRRIGHLAQRVRRPLRHGIRPPCTNTSERPSARSWPETPGGLTACTTPAVCSAAASPTPAWQPPWHCTAHKALKNASRPRWKRGRSLFKSLSGLDGIQVTEFENGSNIFPMSLDDEVDAEAMADALRRNDVHVYPLENPESGFHPDRQHHHPPPAQRHHSGRFPSKPSGNLNHHGRQIPGCPEGQGRGCAKIYSRPGGSVGTGRRA